MDILGAKECERESYQNTVGKLGPKMKKLVLAGAMVTSIGLTSLIYNTTPEDGLWNKADSPAGIEEVVLND